MSSPTVEKNALKAHIPVLDGVRGVAILLVLCVHFFQSFLEKSNTKLFKIALFGQTGVDLFFVLSGFLITGILLDSKGSQHCIRNFYVRRMLRIVPLYYLALVALYLVWPALHLTAWIPFKQNFWYWSYLQDIPWAFDPALQQGPNHFWSLAVEQHYYLVWPFIVMSCHRGKLIKIAGVAILVSLLSRIVWSHYEMYYFTLARLDSLSLGAALAIFSRTPHASGLSRLVPWAWRGMCFVIVAGVLGFVLPSEFLPITRIFRSTLVALFYAAGLLLVLENQCGPFGRMLASGTLRSFGRYSYAMYIFHPFIFAWLLARGWLHYNPWSLLLGVALSYGAGFASWYVLEKPILGFKRYFEYSWSKSRKTDVEHAEMPVKVLASTPVDV